MKRWRCIGVVPLASAMALSSACATMGEVRASRAHCAFGASDPAR